MGQAKIEDAKKLLDEGAVIIDVRTPGEFSGGSVKNSINIPLGEEKLKISNVVKDKNTPILVYCLSGSRSVIAAGKLRKMGYNNVHNLGSIYRAKTIED